MDGNGLKSNRQSVHFGDCVVSVSIIISKKIPARLLFRPKKYNKKIKKNKKNVPARLLVRPWPDQPDRLLRPWGSQVRSPVPVDTNQEEPMALSGLAAQTPTLGTPAADRYHTAALSQAPIA